MLREFFTLFRKLSDEVPVEKKEDDEAAKLDLPADAKEINPVSGKEEGGEDGEKDGEKDSDGSGLKGQPIKAE